MHFGENTSVADPNRHATGITGFEEIGYARNVKSIFALDWCVAFLSDVILDIAEGSSSYIQAEEHPEGSWKAWTTGKVGFSSYNFINCNNKGIQRVNSSELDCPVTEYSDLDSRLSPWPASLSIQVGSISSVC